MVGTFFGSLPVSLDLLLVGISSMHESLIKICSLSFVILTIFIYIIETTNRLNVSSKFEYYMIMSQFIKLPQQPKLNLAVIVGDSMASIYRFGLGFFSKPVVYHCQTANTRFCWASPKLFPKNIQSFRLSHFQSFFRVKADGPTIVHFGLDHLFN